MSRLRLIFLALAVLLGGTAHATGDDLRSVAGMRNHYRVLMVFSPSFADARLTAQRGVVAQLALEAAKRDLLFVQVDPMTVIGASDKADRLRRQFVVPVLNYHTILIDKNGKVLRESHGPMGARAILHAIDTAKAPVPLIAGKPVVDKS